ncbi:MAG: hypothetical protein LBH93_01175, partial [Chitinispirillales bacterium]|nr:hypothetical protein [Chitinispirillales bacterium]
MNGIVPLVVGFLIGGIAASAVWAIIVSGRKKAVSAQRLEKERVMASVGEVLAEADAVETRFRSGEITAESFRRSLGDRVNAVMRQLRTNMHSLDAYFVKYAEQEAREYLRVIDNPERRKLDDAPPLPFSAGSEAGEPDLGSAAAVADEPPVSPPPAPAPIASEPTAWEPDSSVFNPVAGVEFEPSAAPGLIVDAAPGPDAAGEFGQAPDALSAGEAVGDAPPAEAEEEFEFGAPASPPMVGAPVLSETSVVSREERAAPRVVSEEELVLGESAGAAGMPVAPPAAAPEEDIFDVSPPPAPAPAAAHGDSIEEFEAAFAQFEVGVAPQAEGDVFEGPS